MFFLFGSVGGFEFEFFVILGNNVCFEEVRYMLIGDFRGEFVLCYGLWSCYWVVFFVFLFNVCRIGKKIFFMVGFCLVYRVGVNYS